MENENGSAEDTLRSCTECGAWIRSDRVRCPWCGTPNSDPTDPPEPRYDEPTETLLEVETAADLPRRGRRFWGRAFLLATLFVLLSTVALAALGARQGLDDRRIQNKQAAIEWFESGQLYLEEERYDLAVAAFREALRLEPQFEAASQLLSIAEGQAPEVAQAPVETPRTPVTPNNERLFAEAAAAVAARDWAIAIATLDTLRSQSPTYRADEIREALLVVHGEAAREAIEAGRLEEAIRQYDELLLIDPSDATAQSGRRSSAAYLAGLEAFEEEEWSRATNQLRTVYIIDPTFLDTRALLATAHLELGREFEARSIWCEAAQHYRSSLAVQPSGTVEPLATAAEQRCNVRATAAPPTPRATQVRATPVFSATPAMTVTATLIAGTTRLPLPTVTPNPSRFAFELAAAVGVSFDDACGGHYIRGTVRAADGAPLPNVSIQATDEFGNQLVATSKVEPLGVYDIPIPSNPISYELRIVAGPEAQSRTILVQHSVDHSQRPQACHIVDWRRTR